jgi:DNA polymerase
VTADVTDAADSSASLEEPAALVPVPAPTSGLTDPTDVAALQWPELEARVRACQACVLHRTRTQTVFGVGNRSADLLLVGEAPGADEDRQGEPFVGRAGQLLTAMLRAIGRRREDVYIANILKCRPPGNRNPNLDEVAACQGFLQRQIALIQPRLMLSVGAVSARNLLNTDEPVGRLRQRLHHYGDAQVPLLVTYHPAYLLRRPEEKAKAWEDLQEVMRLLDRV